MMSEPSSGELSFTQQFQLLDCVAWFGIHTHPHRNWKWSVGGVGRGAVVLGPQGLVSGPFLDVCTLWGPVIHSVSCSDPSSFSSSISVSATRVKFREGSGGAGKGSRERKREREKEEKEKN